MQNYLSEKGTYGISEPMTMIYTLRPRNSFVSQDHEVNYIKVVSNREKKNIRLEDPYLRSCRSRNGIIYA